MFQDIELKDLLHLQEKEAHTIVDVRSPGEFQEYTIPGSINIPIFSDKERAEVGTIYKQVGKEEAKERGLEIFSAKLPNFIAKFKKIDTPMSVFCWRGGMRSKTAATVLDLMGVHANRLTGGIRSYREWVVSELEKQEFKPELYVLNGNTGSGKTMILHELAEKGYPVIDLEKMANHRGSIFGQIGLKPNKQKKFDSLLVQAMKRYENEPFVFIEGESKRIGRVVLPDFLYDKKEKGKQLFIELPFEKRIDIILEEYHPMDNPEQFREAFQYIKKRIHTPIAKEIDEALEQNKHKKAVRLLLQYYYDPRYEHHIKEYTEQQKVLVQAQSVNEAIEKIENIIDEQKLLSN